MKSPRKTTKKASPKKAVKNFSKKSICGGLTYEQQNNVDYTLLKGIISNDLDAVKKAVLFGANVNSIVNSENRRDIDDFGQSALELACFGGNFSIVKLLVENGANVNEITSHFTVKPIFPLTRALHSCWINKKADRALPPHEYWFAVTDVLHEERLKEWQAKNHEHPHTYDIVHYLLQHGANPMFTDGYTVFDLAKLCNDKRVEEVINNFFERHYAFYDKYDETFALRKKFSEYGNLDRESQLANLPSWKVYQKTGFLGRY